MEIGDTAEHGHEVYPSDIPSLGYPNGVPGLASGAGQASTPTAARMTQRSVDGSAPACAASMQRARALERSQQSAPDRGADASAPRSTPLTLVAGAVAGDDLESVAATVADGARLPGGDRHPGARAAGGLTAGVAGRGRDRRDRRPCRRGRRGAVTSGASPAVRSPRPCRVRHRRPGGGHRRRRTAVAGAVRRERRAWLEAAAAAASVTALIREAQGAPRRRRGAARRAGRGRRRMTSPASWPGPAALGVDLSPGRRGAAARRAERPAARAGRRAPAAVLVGRAPARPACSPIAAAPRSTAPTSSRAGRRRCGAGGHDGRRLGSPARPGAAARGHPRGRAAGASWRRATASGPTATTRPTAC